MIEVRVKEGKTEKEYEANFKKAMLQFKKQVAKSQILIESKDRRYYQKPCEKKKLKKINARKQKNFD